MGSNAGGRPVPGCPVETLRERRSTILADWLARIADSYSEEMSGLLLNETDPFRNPVGGTLRLALPTLLDEILAGTESAAMLQALNDIVQIRAVQDFTPAQAVAFVFQLKDVFREQLRCLPQRHGEGLALESLMNRVDRMALRAFDHFVACREAIYRVKVNEIKRRTFMIERTHPACAAPREEEEVGGNQDSG
jgi:hypothetical protein